MNKLERTKTHVQRDIAQRQQAEEARQETHTDLARLNEQLQKDITARKQVEAALQKSEAHHRQLAKEQMVLAEIGRIISASLNIHEVYEQFAASVRKLFSFDRLVVSLVDPDTRIITTAHLTGPEVPGRQTADTFPLAGSMTGAIFLTQAALCFNPQHETEVAQRLPGLLPLYHHGLRSFLGVPLRSRNSVTGVLHLQACLPNMYTDDMLPLAERIGNQIAGAIANAQLFSELQQAEEALRVSEERLRSFFENAAAGMVIRDREGHCLQVNPAFCHFTGYTRDELVRMTIRDLTHPDDYPVTQMYLDEVRTGARRVVDYEKRYIRKDGRVVWGHLTAAWMFDAQDQPVNGIALVQDITERTILQAQREQTMGALREAKEYAENLINSSLDMIVSADTNGHIIAFNNAAETTFGYQRAEVMGKSVDMLYADEGARQRLRAGLEEHGVFRGEILNKRKDGSTFVSFLAASNLRDQHSALTGVMGISRDITAAKQAEHTLWKAHQRTARLLAAIPSILIGLDTHNQVVWWNAAAEAVFGLAPAAVIGRSLEACGLPWDHTRIVAGLTHCRQTGEPTSLDDVRFQRPDGKEGLLGMTANSMQHASDDELCVLLIGADITERRIMQSQLAQAQKLESIGQLAAGIAHEINTPTQYVGDNTRFLHDAFGDLDTLLTHYGALLQAVKNDKVSASRIQEVDTTAAAIDVDYLRQEIPMAIQQSLEGVDRVATIVRAMKDFSHPGDAEKTGIDLNKAIASTITVARNEWKYVAEMMTDFAPDLPLVACFPAEFNQVILNIIVNAAHALADGVRDGKGTITVSTRQDGEWVEIRIADTGTGIPQAIRDRIFDPFFTTKEVGKGTGQGLAIAHDVVVKKHGGTLTCETEEGEGTTFCIRLPLEGLSVAIGDAV